jgi:hypothetical protein
MRMTIAKKLCAAILLLTSLALAGCPEVAQNSGGASESGGSRGGE